MATYRLSAFSIFLILLAVLLLGYLLNHTYESFMNNTKEGFHVDFSTSGLATTLPGYSVNNKKVVKLSDNVYFDPINKALIESVSNADDTSTLYIKRRDNVDISYNTGLVEYYLEDLGAYDISNNGDFTATALTLDSNTIGTAKSAFTNSTDLSSVYMVVKSDAESFSTITDGTAIASATTYKKSDSAVGTDSSVYPAIVKKGATNARIYRRMQKAQGYVASNAAMPSSSVAQNISYTTKNSTKFGILVIPLSVNSASTNITFIHVVNMSEGNHVKTLFLNGSQVEVVNHTDKLVALGSFTLGQHTKGPGSDTSSLGFTGAIQDVYPEKTTTGEDLKVDFSHDDTKKILYVAARSGNTVFRAYYKIVDETNADSDTIASPIIELVKREISSNTDSSGSGSSSSSDSSSDSSSSGSSSDSSSSDSSSSSSSGSISELNKAINLIKEMQGIFGSSDSNYLLKTEVVPPVCPTCPSCPNTGVCTNCGGNGGSGTNNSGGVTGLARDAGTGATNLARDGATGATNLARDTASGATNMAKDAASGTYGVGKEIVSGTGETVGNVASGTGEFAKDAASGVYGAAKDVTQGTIGLGREVAQGVGGLFSFGGPSTANGGHSNSYGGPVNSGTYPQPGGYPAGGYMNPSQYRTAGQDPYSYYGAVPQRYGNSNYVARTADFSSFGK